MQKKADADYLEACRRQIETRLGWGDSAHWTSRDFEQLSETIQEATQVYLSPTTLKRLWGKVKYDSLPAVTTLDTLAQFAGHESWRSFRQYVQQENQPQMIPSPEQTPVSENPAPVIPVTTSLKKKPRFGWLWPVAGICLVIAVLALYLAGRKPLPHIDAARYTFSSKKVLTEGVPNSVIFDYDATASPFDSVYIQQNWDTRRRTKVSKLQHQFTSVYYYPGFFKAKLVVGGQIVKEHDLVITTKGWLPIIEQMPMPVYFEEKEVRSGNELALSVQQIRDKNVPLQPEAPWVRYSNVGNWGDLKTDHFTLDATLKNDYREGSAICQRTEIRMLCEDAVIIIPLCDKGCVSELNLVVVDTAFQGKDRDLSFLGVDFQNWVHVVCHAANGMFSIYLNDKQVFQSPLPAKAHAIKGIDFRFQGTGRIKDVQLTR